ncbi:hypothetical protein DICPUDRAFT_76059 [Dictyostelium purpureum]|uniref:Peptidase C1A papain C-terminal domain-containing protein n=1 Tax=Dictyostelium purpureum TaxID=5786 RepID=F0ZCH0_DICPU|nr:uncharacterized protein DICPUDRAFT_76059 [Dictyostelium purpureum]EGC38369.1 hypothetical protein DICPUDRAFT_76059 [Dictyostelium purpureum]|eukprot:XP_003285126.1 hypothetical protein DICPUDRAFT_76059 [Dictyostelium purpureum]
MNTEYLLQQDNGVKKTLDPNNQTIKILNNTIKNANAEDIKKELSTLIEKVEPYNPKDPDNFLNDTSTKKRKQGNDQCAFFSVTESIDQFTPNPNFKINLGIVIEEYKNYKEADIYGCITLSVVAGVVPLKFDIDVDLVVKGEPVIQMVITALEENKKISFAMELPKKLWVTFEKKAKGEMGLEKVWNTFKEYAKGKKTKSDKESSEETIRHAMNIVGYNKKKECFIIKNFWGEDKFIYLPFKIFDLEFSEVTDPTFCFFYEKKK